jgi:hypothetical protein
MRDIMTYVILLRYNSTYHYYAECNGILLNAIQLIFILLNVILPSVVTPKKVVSKASLEQVNDIRVRANSQNLFFTRNLQLDVIS